LKSYAVTIQPMSAFGTPLKGDTLFGHFCWQAAYDASLLEGGLEFQLRRYMEQPFAVFSSAFPKLVQDKRVQYLLKRPDMPLSRLFPVQSRNRCSVIEQRKKIKEKRWMVVDEDLRIDLRSAEYLDDREAADRMAGTATKEIRRRTGRMGKSALEKRVLQSHNTIHRLTGTTGSAPFTPFATGKTHFFPKTKLVLFVLIDPAATDIKRVVSGLKRIGGTGFGRDASTGSGRFDLGECEEVTWPKGDSMNACYTLAPAVPEPSLYRSIRFMPFIRFGKHGDAFASSANVFKNPVVMADEGAVLTPARPSVFDRPYLGRGVGEISKICQGAVVQGYAPYLPFRLE